MVEEGRRRPVLEEDPVAQQAAPVPATSAA
jgi:hypothetical protein